MRDADFRCRPDRVTAFVSYQRHDVIVTWLCLDADDSKCVYIHFKERSDCNSRAHHVRSEVNWTADPVQFSSGDVR